jgi:glycosyltransferase involved in cell wall biosynthesis|tara:strand:+ start:4801 stop:6165 length:1365 start_codon:yes stop_codon:yes gene_type:complete
MGKRFGFVSTRFAGTDGVSLESAKWAEVLWDDRHVSHWYGGLLDRQPEISMCVPEAYFGHPEVVWINERIWGQTRRAPLVSRRIRELADYLKGTLYQFVQKFGIDVLIPENALTIPMHVPLGIAITEFIAETGIPTIAHHHDFYWERTRFSISAVQDHLDLAFPCRLPSIAHTVINAAAQQQLSLRKGVGSIVTPNVFEFEKQPPVPDEYSADVREEIGLSKDDIFILQPTRIVPRKGIEHAIKLVSMLNDPRYKLVISHEAGDEGYEYKHMLEELAREEEVELVFIGDRVSEVRQYDSKGRKLYTLWDLYPHADLVTYPSTYEGFGNALLEAIYFKKPIVINRYSIFVEDIEPKGFKLAVIDGFITRQVTDEVKRLLSDEAYHREVVEHNFEVANRYYSYSVLRRSLRTVLTSLTGWAPPSRPSAPPFPIEADETAKPLKKDSKAKPAKAKKA